MAMPSSAAQSSNVNLWGGLPQAIVVRTTENVTQGNWVWLLNSAKAARIGRIYLLVKQDENEFASKRTDRTLRSGELLVELPGETTATGWENSDWLREMLDRAKSFGIEIYAWWPVFQDAVMAANFPDAIYNGSSGEVFVDPAVDGVAGRQQQLIEKLLATYAFDGVALDWIRYNRREDGSRGPLARRFKTETGRAWSQQLMAEPLPRAIWDDMRAAAVANWIAGLISENRRRRPSVKWGAFVLPWQFKEVAQSYRRLGNIGLDFLQPMIYWADWKKSPDFAAQVMRGNPYWLKGNTRAWPTFDINRDVDTLLEGIASLNGYRLAGMTWYLHDSWLEGHFQRLHELAVRWHEVAPDPTSNGKDLIPPAPRPVHMERRLPLAQFAPDANLWSLVCLGELYNRGELSDHDKVVPVLALHRFNDGSLGSGPTLWYNSTAYLDRLFEFLEAYEFSPLQLATLEAFMISEDPSILPARPIALTIDDGSATIFDHFHARAADRRMPYAVSLITGLVKPEAEEARLDDYAAADPILSTTQVAHLRDSGLVSFPSHTHALHYWGRLDRQGERTGPALINRLWLEGRDRKERHADWISRISRDLATSRTAIASLTNNVPRALTWPYGAYDGRAENAARNTGFTSFLLFGDPAFAAPRFDNSRITRVSVTRADEAVPLHFPADEIMQQRWWLAFLSRARMSGSAALMEAVLGQLASANADHPEAELTRALIEALKGFNPEAAFRIRSLRKSYPHDAEVHAAIGTVITQFGVLF